MSSVEMVLVEMVLVKEVLVEEVLVEERLGGKISLVTSAETFIA